MLFSAATIVWLRTTVALVRTHSYTIYASWAFFPSFLFWVNGDKGSAFVFRPLIPLIGHTLFCFDSTTNAFVIGHTPFCFDSTINDSEVNVWWWWREWW